MSAADAMEFSVVTGTGRGSQTVNPTLVADQVYEVLAKRIYDGELAAGDRLPVRDLAKQVGTSVMPVREAIQLLVKNGLAVAHPHRGARVREFTVHELLDLYEVRTILEVEATRKGAASVTRDDLHKMRGACERMYRAVVQGRVTDALDEDEDLLRHLYRSGSNDVLVSTIDSLWIQCRPYKVIGARAALEVHDSSLWTPQPALIDALSAGDTEQAVTITRDSLLSARQRLVREMRVPEDSSQIG
ncbi:GntR family transcriptional regulator [Streptomyces sp. BV286]|uniref:GntR family transcriptional regulator n=1 Tax=Streptomyces sp. BV286 TaxID=2849672 RepID=UPI001C2E310B|nr:GntR family transcriptional regulator [Streptomyces sp. BV286]MBV1940418.1 GntR family transcriptional regulator [Streptomyces sp. BV286]